MNGGRPRVAGLDGVRALCVMLVFLEHYSGARAGLGAVGVNVFFALSGYLIIGILHGQRLAIEAGDSTPFSALHRFWVGRVLRIFPVYYLVLGAWLLYFLIIGRSLQAKGLPYYFGFAANYYIQYISHGWDSFTHLWTISVEQHFYMLASPLLLWAPARRHALIVAGLFVVGQYATAQDFVGWETLSRPNLADLPSFSFMACGGLLALAHAGTASTGRPAVISGVFISATLAFGALIGGWVDPGTTSAKWALIQFAMLAQCFALMAYLPQRQESALVKALEWKPLRYLGTVSYGFYVYHYFFPHFAAWAGDGAMAPYAALVLTLVQFLATVAVAALSWHFFEKPILAFKTPSHPRAKRRGIVEQVQP